jgi:hypothetical protein
MCRTLTKHCYHLFFACWTILRRVFCFVFLADIISTVEFNYSGELLATGDKGGRVVIFQHEQEVHYCIMVVTIVLVWIHSVQFALLVHNNNDCFVSYIFLSLSQKIVHNYVGSTMSIALFRVTNQSLTI